MFHKFIHGSSCSCVDSSYHSLNSTSSFCTWMPFLRLQLSDYLSQHYFLLPFSIYFSKRSNSTYNYFNNYKCIRLLYQHQIQAFLFFTLKKMILMIIEVSWSKFKASWHGIISTDDLPFCFLLIIPLGTCLSILSKVTRIYLFFSDFCHRLPFSIWVYWVNLLMFIYNLLIWPFEFDFLQFFVSNVELV